MPFRLSAKDIDAIRKGQKKLIEARETIAALQRCGENCDQPIEEVDSLYRLADGYLREFGNGGQE